MTTVSESPTAFSAGHLSMHDFIMEFGVQIFVLWKALLLGKRVLFYSKVPIGSLCCKVYCASELLSHSCKEAFKIKDVNPIFFVSTHDIDSLEKSTSGWVACTSDLIFEWKTHIYDIYVDGPEVKTSKQSKNYLRVTSKDKQRWQTLQLMLRGYSNATREKRDEAILDFFTKLNDKLFKKLDNVGGNSGRSMSCMKPMCLYEFDLSSSDIAFMTELNGRYQVPLVPCCCCFRGSV